MLSHYSQKVLTAHEIGNVLSEVRASYAATKYAKEKIKACWPCKVVVTSGFFSPLGLHHLQMLYDATKYGNFWIVIVNDDKILKEKKGYVWENEQSRIAKIASLACVHYACLWPESDVSGALKLIRPDVFLNGGDVTLETLNKNEFRVCKEIKCRLVFDTKGKSGSSSQMIEQSLKAYNERTTFIVS